jgi:hypothetical protein
LLAVGPAQASAVRVAASYPRPDAPLTQKSFARPIESGRCAILLCAERINVRV